MRNDTKRTIYDLLCSAAIALTILGGSTEIAIMLLWVKTPAFTPMIIRNTIFTIGCAVLVYAFDKLYQSVPWDGEGGTV